MRETGVDRALCSSKNMPHKRDKSPKRGKPVGMSAGWVFTVNNYSKADIRQLKVIAESKSNSVEYMVFGKEVGEKGTPHLQGYVHFETRKRFTTVQKLFQLSSAPHFEGIRGTPEQAAVYCKKDGDFWEYGVCPEPEPGKRNDLIDVKHKIDGGNCIDDLARDDEHFGSFVRYARNLSRYEDNLAGPRNFKSQVVVFYGDPGTFKSYSANRFKDRYEVVRPTGKHQPVWYDGYVPREHTTVCYDDFYGWLPFANLLQLCDRYQCRVQAKGATKQFRPAFVVFTSNSHPQQWYNDAQLRYSALERRIDQLYEHFFADAADDKLGVSPGDILIRVHKGYDQLHPLYKFMSKLNDALYKLDMPLMNSDELDTQPTLEQLLEIYEHGLQEGFHTHPQLVEGSRSSPSPSAERTPPAVKAKYSRFGPDYSSSEDMDGAEIEEIDSSDSGDNGSEEL